MSDKIIESSDSNFESEVLQSSVPVLVDFWAPWCGPCKAVAPTLEKIAASYEGKLKIVKINVDENPKTPHSYDVRGIPNLVFFKGGKVVDRVVGAVPEDELVTTVEKVIS